MTQEPGAALGNYYKCTKYNGSIVVAKYNVEQIIGLGVTIFFMIKRWDEELFLYYDEGSPLL